MEALVATLINIMIPQINAVQRAWFVGVAGIGLVAGLDVGTKTVFAVFLIVK